MRLTMLDEFVMAFAQVAARYGGIVIVARAPGQAIGTAKFAALKRRDRFYAS